MKVLYPDQKRDVGRFDLKELDCLVIALYDGQVKKSLLVVLQAHTGHKDIDDRYQHKMT